MRGAAMLVLGWVAACAGPELEPPIESGDPSGGLIEPVRTGPGTCDKSGSTCPSGEVCTRIGLCYPPSAVRSVSVSWTMNDLPAGADTCGATPNFEVELGDDGAAQIAWAPVPCIEGKFTVDALPMWINTVVIDATIDNEPGAKAYGMFDETTGEAAIDLPF